MQILSSFQGNEYVWNDVWGEQMTEKRQSVVCVLDVESAVVSVLDNLPEDVCAAQVHVQNACNYIVTVTVLFKTQK